MAPAGKVPPQQQRQDENSESLLNAAVSPWMSGWLIAFRASLGENDSYYLDKHLSNLVPKGRRELHNFCKSRKQYLRSESYKGKKGVGMNQVKQWGGGVGEGVGGGEGGGEGVCGEIGKFIRGLEPVRWPANSPFATPWYSLSRNLFICNSTQYFWNKYLSLLPVYACLSVCSCVRASPKHPG